MTTSLAKYIKKYPAVITAVMVFVFFTGYYVLLLFRHTSSDIQAHAGIAYAYAVNGDKLFPNFLYFFLVAMFAGFSKNMHMYYAAAVLLISVAIAAKYYLSARMIQRYCSISNNEPLRYVVPSLMLLFVFALPGINFFENNQFYYGLLPPNVWHNSTVIFLAPFSILLFFKSFQLFFTNAVADKKLLIQVFILVLLNAFIKPSFLFTIIPAVFIVAVFNAFSKKSITGFRALLPYIAGLVAVALQYYLIFRQNHISGVVDGGTASEVVVAPFEVWKYYSPNIAVSFIASFFFPLVYIVVSKGQVLKNTMVQFALLNYTGGIAVWVLFAEEGFRKYDANFCWQAIIGAYLLYLCLLIQFINDRKAGSMNKLQLLVTGGSFMLHFLWGIVYWAKIIIFKSYL